MKIVRLVIAAAIVIGMLAACSLFQGKVVITNYSSQIINDVFISPSDEDTWGDDWLTTIISPGASHEFDGIWPGTYDLRVQTTTAGVAENWGITVEANKSFTWTLTD